MLMSLLVSLSLAASAACAPPVATDRGEVRPVPAVTCCCRTYQGGMCCAETTSCGGIVPGCFCR